MTVLVTAAYGNQGRLLLPKLAKLGMRVRGLRGNGSAEDLKKIGATEAMVGDAADPKIMDKAVQGIRTVYYIGPATLSAERAMGIGMVDAALKAGVEHFVFSSVLHPILTGMIHHIYKRDIEEHLICSGLNFTILRPADYMQVKRWNVFESGVYKRRWSADRDEALVDLEDVTDVAAKVIKEDAAHYGATYDLVGDHLNGHELIAAMSKAAVREIKLVISSSEDFSKSFLGTTERNSNFNHTMKLIDGMTSWYGTHDFVGNSNVATMLLGRKPNSFAVMMQREFAAYQARQK